MHSALHFNNRYVERIARFQGKYLVLSFLQYTDTSDLGSVLKGKKKSYRKHQVTENTKIFIVATVSTYTTFVTTI